ncbi:MAG: prepilin-type N-terminal cleavage/methylation domain-containing protein [Rhodoferax sp.]|nr:prepilin-type N-terminal cleavage/methylation domain-containing protein [Rhodoferax sp.]MCF8212062.1 prepilin-type N-terminal cleavage/methylation domain-containing protein [Rhodoferax sp.]
MSAHPNLPSAQQGSSLIEVLVTLVILMLGMMGLVGLMVQGQRSQMESYQRVQALVVLQDMANRINVNHKAAGCYVTASYLGSGGTVPIACPASPVLTAEQSARALADLEEWQNLLLGSGEVAGGSNVGAMLGARGCVTVDATTGVYQVSVVWQGTGQTFAPPASIPCGSGLYGSETLRRAVSVPVQITSLS